MQIELAPYIRSFGQIAIVTSFIVSISLTDMAPGNSRVLIGPDALSRS